MSLSIYEGLGIIFFVIIITYALAHKYLWSKKLLIILFLICNAIYLIWRTFYSLPTINLISIIAGIILLITEWAGYLQSIVLALFHGNHINGKKYHYPLLKNYLLSTYLLPLTMNRSIC